MNETEREKRSKNLARNLARKLGDTFFLRLEAVGMSLDMELHTQAGNREDFSVNEITRFLVKEVKAKEDGQTSIAELIAAGLL